MEKALEILKEIRNTENEYDHLKKHRFDNAISELEEAMKPKSCEGCKYFKDPKAKWECGIGFRCQRAFRDRYEPKENK